MQDSLPSYNRESEKMVSVHKESALEADVAVDLNRVDTVDVDNYHGLGVKTVLVYLSLNLIITVQILNLVASGAFARNIAAAVGGSSETVWLTQSIAIITCVLGPPVSQAADYWGRKWFIIVLTLFSVVGSIIVSRATSMGMAIAGEAVSAFGYGAQPVLYAVASEILPRRFRPAAQAGVNIFGAFGAIFTLLAGSTIISKSIESFRVFWYITAAVTAVSVTTLMLCYNPPLRPLQRSLRTMEKLTRLDWIGYALLASGIVFFCMGLSWAENPYSWKDAHVLAPLLVGAALLISFAVHQTFLKRDGLFHHELFKKDRNFALAVVVIFVEGMVFFAVNGYFTFEMSILYETTSFRAGLRFCVSFFFSILGAIGIAIYSSMTKQIRVPIVVSFTLFVIFCVLMATAKTSSSAAMWAYPMFVGTGLGICLTCIVTVAQLSAPPALIAISSGLIISARSLGGSVALAIYNAIFNSEIGKHLGADISAAVLPLGLSPKVLPQFISALSAGDQKALGLIPGVTPEIIGAGAQGLKDAYISSFRYVWVTAAVFSLVATIAALFFINPSNDLTMHVDAPLEEDS